MHNNHFFLKRLVAELSKKLEGATLLACFSQSKDELVLGFALKNKADFYWKADLKSTFSCLYFPQDFARAKRNSVNLFPEILHQKVKQVFVFKNERAICLEFKNSYSLVFKLFGNRSSLILYKDELGVKVFNKQYEQDKSHPKSSWHRELIITEEVVASNQQELYKVCPTLGKELSAHISKQAKDFNAFQLALQNLAYAPIYISEVGDLPQLLLFSTTDNDEKYPSALEAINQFYQKYIRIHSLDDGKKVAKRDVNSKIKQATKRKKKLKIRLEELMNERPLNQLADIIMANLHQIPKNVEKVVLFDFYQEKDIEVALKRNKTPQDIAAQWYKKSKNRSKEIDALENNLNFLEEEIADLNKILSEIDETDSMRDLGKYRKEVAKQVEKEAAPRFKEYAYRDYVIYVGRNSKNNDELTKSAHKDDLWLHAKDVSGSHVIIKNKSGQKVPKDVIEYAAGIAAFYSKRKTDTLCPVMVTARKYVRKIKGAPAGAVMVDKEEVVLVKPLEV